MPIVENELLQRQVKWHFFHKWTVWRTLDNYPLQQYRVCLTCNFEEWWYK